MKTDSIRLRAGAVVSPFRVIQEGDVLHMCSKERCPHYAGQLPLPGAPSGDRDFYCKLTGSAPAQTCGPLYCEMAEDLDAARREKWTMEEAEAAERRRNRAAAALEVHA